ncbi:MAG: mechanosensitive ion channel family protein [Bacillota bacterium]
MRWRRIFTAIFLLAVFFFTVWADRVFQVLLDRYLRGVASRTQTHIDTRFLPVIRYAGRIAFCFVALTIALGHFRVNLTGFLAMAGIASLAIAFATQETLSNMVAGFILMLDRPFGVGDRIEVLGTTLVGEVLEIGTRSTKLLTLDNTLAVLANKDLVAGRIINHSRPDAAARLRVAVGVPYTLEIETVKELVLVTLKEHPAVLPTPPAVYLTEFTETQVRVTGVCSIADFRDALKVRDELNTAIMKKLQAAGIFPRQVPS